MKYHTKKIFMGILLALFLGSSSIIVANYITDTQYRPYYADDMIRIKAHMYWDMSSGLSLAKALEDNGGDVFFFSTQASVVEAVTGQSDNIEATCEPAPCNEDIFAYASRQVPYYSYNTSSVYLRWLVPDQAWKTDIHTSRVRDFSIVNQTLALNPISRALIEDYKQIENLTKVSEEVFGFTWKESVDVGATYIEITQGYTDGTMFRITLIGQNLFIEIRHFNSYYADSTVMAIQSDGSVEYYTGSTPAFFPNYIDSVNQLIGQFLGAAP